MKVLKFTLYLFPLIFSLPTHAQIEDQQILPSFNGDESMEQEQLEMERLEEEEIQREEEFPQEEEFDEEKYNMNVNPDDYKVDENVYPKEEKVY